MNLACYSKNKDLHEQRLHALTKALKFIWQVKNDFMRVKLYFIVITVVIILTGCKEEEFYNLDKMPDDGVILTRWQVLGPFPAKGKDHFLEVDNLSQFGFKETTITYRKLSRISPKDTSQKYINQLVDTSGYKTDFNKLSSYTTKTTINGNVYCACILKSSRKRKLKLNFSADDGSKVWLNHELIYSSDRTNGVKYYDNYLDITIKKGKNLLLIKVNNIKSDWEMFAAIEEATKERERRYKKTFSLEFGRNFLRRSAVNDDSLALNEDLPEGKYNFCLADSEGNHIISTVASPAKTWWNISNLKEGLYSATLYTRNDTFTETLYKGNITEATQLLIKKLEGYSLNVDIKRNIEALKYRYTHLLNPENAGKNNPGKRDWDKKMILLFDNLSFYANHLNQGKEKTGGSIKTYVSKIDDGIQYYQLFVPKNYKNEKGLPLIIELPKFMNRHPSPLETYRFANIRLFELFEELSNKYNMIILDPGCRTIDKANMNTIDEADLWENITDVRKHYTIDTTRIYLRGACLSSRSVMKLAVKYPDKFAALSLTAPQIELSDIDNIWLQQNEPINYLMNITNLPVLNIHSKLDPHIPFRTSEDLFKAVQNAGLKQFMYRKLPMEFKKFYSEEYLEDIFSFFCQCVLHPNPKEVFFSTSQLKYNKSFWITLNEITPEKKAVIHAEIENNLITVKKESIISYSIDLTTLPLKKDQLLTIIDNGSKVFEAKPENSIITINPSGNRSHQVTKNAEIEGPLAHIFNQSFIVVTGTTGDKQENRKIQALADTINKYWTLKYYSGCRIKQDKNITAKDINESNLLLLGTSQSNLVLKKWEGKLPLKINKSSIKIVKNTVNGTELGFYFIYPNPYNPHKYVAVIGYNNPTFISLGYEDNGKDKYFNDVSNYGWYDYKIWDAKTTTSIASGYFDHCWK